MNHPITITIQRNGKEISWQITDFDGLTDPNKLPSLRKEKHVRTNWDYILKVAKEQL